MKWWCHETGDWPPNHSLQPTAPSAALPPSVAAAELDADRAYCEAQGGDPDDPEHWAWLDGCCYDPNYCGAHVYGRTGIAASCISSSCNPRLSACQGTFALKRQNGWYTGDYSNRDKLSPSINYHLDVLNETVPDYHWVQGP